ncbi:Lysine histidine transporter-like 5 [Linum perenne]
MAAIALTTDPENDDYEVLVSLFQSGPPKSLNPEDSSQILLDANFQRIYQSHNTPPASSPHDPTRIFSPHNNRSSDAPRQLIDQSHRSKFRFPADKDSVYNMVFRMNILEKKLYWNTIAASHKKQEWVPVESREALVTRIVEALLRAVERMEDSEDDGKKKVEVKVHLKVEERIRVSKEEYEHKWRVKRESETIDDVEKMLIQQNTKMNKVSVEEMKRAAVTAMKTSSSSVLPLDSGSIDVVARRAWEKLLFLSNVVEEEEEEEDGEMMECSICLGPKSFPDHSGDNNHYNNNNNNNGTLGDGERDLSNWLPITASRKAKWWYSAFHNVTAMVGAGVLGLPFAMSELGWAPGLIVIGLSWSITFYSLWQMVEMHELVPGKRFDRYHELGQHAFGEKLGYWIVFPQQFLVQFASNIVYMVTGGKSLKKAAELAIPEAGEIRQTYFILMFCCLQLVLSQTPNFNSLKIVSILAALMSGTYSMIAFVASTVKGSKKGGRTGVSYELRAHTKAGIIFEVLNGLGEIAFAFAGHSVVLEIQATIPSTPEKPSKKPMWKGVVVAYMIVLVCYGSVAVSGYWAYGNKVDDDVLISLQHPVWLISAANFMVFIHVIGSYQIFAMPMFDTIEGFLVRKCNFKPSRILRVVARSLYVALTAFIGMCIPFFGGLLGFFGGLVFASTSFFASIIVGVAIAILAPIGGMRNIILSAKSYKFFS